MARARRDKARSEKQFFSGVMILTLSTVLVKLIGLLYKIPMMEYLGAEGMGYFNSAYDIYTMFFVISTAGLPVAISIMIAENKAGGRYRNVKKIFKVSLTLLFFVGLAGTLLMSVFSDGLSSVIHNGGARLCILAISPTVLFICISSAIRGYFQGNQIMLPTAISQVIESAGKLFLGLTFAIIALNKGYDMPTVAAFAVLGISIGVAISMLFLIICRIFYKPELSKDLAVSDTQSSSVILKRLLAVAIPITLSSTVISLTRVVDMTMILGRLQAIGYSSDMANAVYGSYSTMAVSIYNLPTTLITAISVPLVPMLTTAFESKDKIKEKATLSSSIKLTALVAFPASLGIAVFSKPILELLFSSQTKEIEYTAPLLSILGISVFLACMITLTNAILQSYRLVNKPIISMIIGAIVKIVASYILIGIPNVNIYGAPISTFLSVLAIVSVNLYYIIKKTGRFDGVLSLFGRPFAASFLSVAGGLSVYVILDSLLPSKWNAMIAVALVVLTYVILALKLRAIDKDDIAMMPLGEKLVKLFVKIKLLK